jgi:cardiolipin synthase A/B
MKYKLYTTSRKAWDAMISSIEKAEKCIYIEMYIFLPDTKSSHDFLGKLKEKAESGVRVVVVADAFGSKELKKEISKYIDTSKIEFIFFSHWLRHIHRKILIIDEKIAFIGGVNIGERFKNWNDLQIKLKGKIVNKILKSFAYTYEMSGGKDKKILEYRKKKISYKLKFWIIEHWPIKNIYSLKNHYIEKITNAKNSIRIATPYFTPPRWLISLLDDASRRKVKVEIIIPKKVDWKIMNLINYRYIQSLHPLGIKFYLMENMNHSKLLIIDDQESLVGSQNVDLFSFKINTEIGVFSKDKKLLRNLLEVFEEWKKNSSEFNPLKYKMKFMDYFILAIMKIIRPIL